MLHFEFLGLLSESSISSELVRVSNPNTHMPMTRYKIGPVYSSSSCQDISQNIIMAGPLYSSSNSNSNINNNYYCCTTDYEAKCQHERRDTTAAVCIIGVLRYAVVDCCCCEVSNRASLTIEAASRTLQYVVYPSPNVLRSWFRHNQLVLLIRVLVLV